MRKMISKFISGQEISQAEELRICYRRREDYCVLTCFIVFTLTVAVRNVNKQFPLNIKT